MFDKSHNTEYTCVLINHWRSSMLGFTDPWIFIVYLLCILSTTLCVVYGIINWNKGADEEPEQIREEAEWEKGEEEIREEIGE